LCLYSLRSKFSEKWTYELEWIGKKGFQGADVHEYLDVGKARTSDGFTFLQVYDAGHMVPTDQPKRSLQMIQNFVTGGKF
jgi:cathepsin A (carboxypeptidase C)